MATNELAVYWSEGEQDLFAANGPVAQQLSGKLTLEHAACNYGQPVLVREDGVVLGAGDLPAGTVLHSTYGQLAGSHEEIVSASRAAGYNVDW